MHYDNMVDNNVQYTSNVIECEKKLSTAVCSKIAPAIRNLLKDNGSLAQNLQTLNNDVSRKLEDISSYVEDVVETTCKYRLKEYNSFRENINLIKEHINCMFLNQKQIVKDYKFLSKVYYICLSLLSLIIYFGRFIVANSLYNY